MCSGSSNARVLLTLSFVAAVTAACLPVLTRAEEIRIGGTGNALGTMRLLGSAYAKLHPDSRPIILDSIGTSGAIKAVPTGAIEIGLSSRPLKDEEAARGIVTVEYARSPTVFAVQAKSGAKSITLAEIADIYAGRMTSWPDGSRIRPIMRQPGDDNTRQVKTLSAEIEEALAAAEKREGLIYASNDQEAADKMESIPGSIGVTTIALIRSENRKLQALAIDGTEPTLENMRSGRYPMLKQFYFLLGKQYSPKVRRFLDFVKSPQGRKILEQNGNVVP